MDALHVKIAARECSDIRKCSFSDSLAHIPYHLDPSPISFEKLEQRSDGHILLYLMRPEFLTNK
jgi:hypothetical protein